MVGLLPTLEIVGGGDFSHFPLRGSRLSRRGRCAAYMARGLGRRPLLPGHGYVRFRRVTADGQNTDSLRAIEGRRAQLPLLVGFDDRPQDQQQEDQLGGVRHARPLARDLDQKTRHLLVRPGVQVCLVQQGLPFRR